jgi:uncharacterized protein (TIGR02996 family)
MGPEDAFRAAILTEPDDHVHRLIYADWLLEADPVREPLVRAQGLLGPSLRNTVGMKMVPIPAGTFRMGSPIDEQGRDLDEEEHEVRLTRPFYLAAHPVTIRQFGRFAEATGYETLNERGELAIAGWYAQTQAWQRQPAYSWYNPGWSQADDEPVVCLDYADAQAFCQWLAGVERRPYRLPTEAEWEYACRAGTTTPFHFGDNLTPKQANYDTREPYRGKRSRRRGPGRTTPVGSYPPNAFGLYDLHGNVWEWCHDWYDPDYYDRGPRRNPHGPRSGAARALRGGSWFTPARDCRSALRRCGHPWMSRYRDGACGFRVALTGP